MNSIGFTNFRRFHNFPEINLGDITLLVGGNNSGKSTLVKAILLCVDNLCNTKTHKSVKTLFNRYPEFRFDSELARIGSFAKALNNTCENKELSFIFSIGTFKFCIKLQGIGSEDTTLSGNPSVGYITYLSIMDEKNMLSYEVNYSNGTMSFGMHGNISNDYSKAISLYHQLERAYAIYYERTNAVTEEDYSEDNLTRLSEANAQLGKIQYQTKILLGIDDDKDVDLLDLLEKRLVDLKSNSDFKEIKYKTEYRDYVNKANVNLFTHVISNFMHASNDKEYLDKMIDALKLEANDKSSALSSLAERMLDSFHQLCDIVSNADNVEYLNAHGVNQNPAYIYTGRSGDHFASVIYDFVNCNIKTDEEEYQFVLDWMDEFGIGASFEISNSDGVVFSVSIKDKTGNKTNLSDCGIGSMQMMMLLLHLASIIRKYNLTNMTAEGLDMHAPTLIIEEPEQNLHPKLQSKIADLLYYLNKRFGIKFLIETHSEYLIRNTQVIVHKELQEVNPFRVYYLLSDYHDTDVPYYEMHYHPDGRFAEDFGPGFMDVSEDLSFEIL